MHDYWAEFFQVALAHLLAVASPGPDFAIVLRQCLRFGRRTAIWTSLGVGAAISLHVAYSLFGLGLLVKGSAPIFSAVKYAGAVYLASLGVQSLRSRPRGPVAAEAVEEAVVPSARAAWLTGFFTNALNPKVTLFFVALFVTVIDPATPKGIQAGYGLWMVAATTAWFCLVSLVFARRPVRDAFLRRGHWVDRVLGVVFIAFAASLAWSAVN